MGGGGGGGGGKKRSSSGVGIGRGSRKGTRLKDVSAPSSPSRSTSNQTLGSGKPPPPLESPREHLNRSGRRLSEWQLKLRNSGPFKPQDGAGGAPGSKLSSSKSQTTLPSLQSSKAVQKKRSDSVDYTPDGLSPGLEDSVKEYDPEGKHRPMGLAGLLGEPDDESE